jgi:hypothetical protein
VLGIQVLYKSDTRLEPDVFVEGQVLYKFWHQAEFAFNNKGWKNAYVLQDDLLEYTKSLGAYFEGRYAELGGTIVGEDVFTGNEQLDPSANITRLRDAAKNAHFVYTSFKNILVAQSALVDANRSGRTKSSLGLLQQAELSYRRRWISAVQIYEQSLDDLKVQLGIPVKEPILLEQQELEKLELIAV